MSNQGDRKKELDKFLGLYKLIFKNGMETEVPATSPQHAVKVLALALELSQQWVWNSLREIHIIKKPEIPIVKTSGEVEH